MAEGVDGSVTEQSLVRIARTSFDAPEHVTPDGIAQALAELRAPKLPLKRAEVGLDGPMSRLVEDGLRPIGAAVDPRLSPEQAKAWRKALLLKLSNIPGDILVAAVRRSMHTTFRFLADVESDVRKQAEAIKQEQQIALMRLERWQRDLERAKVPAIAPPPPKPLTQADVDAMNGLMSSIGSATRWKLENGEAVMVSGPSTQRSSEE